jgi:hypothetical protein
VTCLGKHFSFVVRAKRAPVLEVGMAMTVVHKSMLIAMHNAVGQVD